jgi:hypothetical protein
MDLPSESISHAASPIARVVPDLRAGAGLGSPVREVVLRTPARCNGHHRLRSAAPTHRKSTGLGIAAAGALSGSVGAAAILNAQALSDPNIPAGVKLVESTSPAISPKQQLAAAAYGRRPTVLHVPVRL